MSKSVLLHVTRAEEVSKAVAATSYGADGDPVNGMVTALDVVCGPEPDEFVASTLKVYVVPSITPLTLTSYGGSPATL
jgi:hypothetical protein